MKQFSLNNELKHKSESDIAILSCAHKKNLLTKCERVGYDPVDGRHLAWAPPVFSYLNEEYFFVFFFLMKDTEQRLYVDTNRRARRMYTNGVGAPTSS